MSLIPRLRNLLAALVVLVLSAGIAFAGRPTTMPSVPDEDQTAGETVTGEAVEEAAEEVDQDTEEASEDEDAPDADQETDQDAGDATAEHPENHGKYVSEAAKLPTPEGYDNHGQYVREVAHGTDGKKAGPAAAKSAGKAKGHAKGGSSED